MEITPFQGFASYQPLIADIPSAPYSTGADISVSKNDSKKETKDKGIGGLSESMINRLMDHGLKSDVESFLYRMGDAINHAYDPVTGQPDLAAYMLLIPELTQIKNNHDEYKEARQQLLNKKAINDYAMTPDGAVCVAYLDDNQQMIQRWMSVPDVLSQFKDNMGSIHILTNGELAKYRSENIQMAFNQDIVNILAGATGMQDITNYLKESLPHLGESSLKVTTQSEAIAHSSEFQDSVNALQSLLTGSKMTEEHTNQQGQAALALNYLINTMPDNMRAQLQLRAARTGQTAASIIESYIGSTLKTVDSYTTTGNTGTKTKAGGTGGDIKMNEAMLWLNDRGFQRPISIQKGTSDALGLVATCMPIKNSQGNLITVSDLNASEFAGVLDLSSASAADNIIPTAALPNVVVQSNALYKVDLPIDIYYLNTFGIIKPDLQWLPKIELAEQQGRENGCLDNPEAMNAIYQELGIPLKYVDGEKKLTAQYYTFGVLNGYVPSNIFDANTVLDEDFIKEVTNEVEINNVLGVVNKNIDESQPNFDFGTNTAWYQRSGKLYSTDIFIPVRSDVFNAMVGGSQLPTVSQANQLSRLQAEHNVKTEVKKQFTPGGYVN